MIKINLIYDRKALEVRKVGQELVLALLLTIIVFVLIGFLWNMQITKVDEIKKKLAVSKAKRTQLTKVKKKIESFEKTKKNLDTRINAINLLVSLKKGPARVFDELNYLLPDDIWLNTISQAKGSITIKGYSFTNPGIANLMNNLKQSHFFTKVDLIQIKKSKVSKTSVNSFTMVIGLKILTDPGPKQLTRQRVGSSSVSNPKGGLFGLGGEVENVFSKQSALEFGQKLSKELKATPQQRLFEAKRLQRESEKKRKEMEEFIKQTESGVP